jgi:glycosyltransferase involved in cell wall biosynthesis
MRVLHLASWYPNPVNPQLGNFVRRHALAVHPFVNGVILHAWPSSNYVDWSLFVDENCISVERLFPVVHRAPRFFRTYWTYRRAIQKLIAEGWRPDLIHLHIAGEAAWAARWAADYCGAPLVVSENWTAYHAELGRSFSGRERRTVKRALQAAALHLPVSEHLGRAMARFAPDVPQQVVPNVVDALFAPPVEPRATEGPLRLLHVSSMVDDHKNITGMLRAVSAAVEQGADAVLDCYGGAGAGGEELPRYKAQAEMLGLQERVAFHGPAEPEVIAAAMGRADAFVLFSRYENLPCVILEAWSTGLPVMATDVGGVSEHLGDRPELGALMGSEDEAALTAAIVDRARRKTEGEVPETKAIADYAAARFAPAAVGAQILEAYRSVLR